LEGISRRPPEFIRRVLLARRLNVMMATNFFTPWNVGHIPADDLADLDDWIRYGRELGIFGAPQEQ
jgi:hypothetical protein